SVSVVRSRSAKLTATYKQKPSIAQSRHQKIEQFASANRTSGELLAIARQPALTVSNCKDCLVHIDTLRELSSGSIVTHSVFEARFTSATAHTSLIEVDDSRRSTSGPVGRFRCTEVRHPQVSIHTPLRARLQP